MKLLTVVVAICFWLSCASPVQAAVTNPIVGSANFVDPELETSVLQIIRNHPEVVIESFQIYREQQIEQQEKTKELLFQQLKTDPQTIVGDSPKTGEITGKILLLEFSDFQCPYCGKAHQTVNDFLSLHSDDVTLVYKHFPLTAIHAEAMAAAKAAWAADRQGKFWPYHDVLFEQQGKLGERLYLDIANNLHLDLEQFNRDRNDPKAELSIQKDMQLAERAGIEGTPYFLINGKTLSGAIPLSMLEDAL